MWGDPPPRYAAHLDVLLCHLHARHIHPVLLQQDHHLVQGLKHFLGCIHGFADFADVFHDLVGRVRSKARRGLRRQPQFFSNGCSKEEPSLPRKFVRSRPWSGTDKRRKLCNGHSQRVRVPVPERSRRRGDGVTGVDAGADGHQPLRDTLFIDADDLPLSEQFASLYAAFPWNNRSRAHQRSR